MRKGTISRSTCHHSVRETSTEFHSCLMSTDRGSTYWTPVSSSGWCEMEREEEGFRFKTRKEYEKQLEKLIQKQSRSRSSKGAEEYEDLMEEYLKFCERDVKYSSIRSSYSSAPLEDRERDCFWI